MRLCSRLSASLVLLAALPLTAQQREASLGLNLPTAQGLEKGDFAIRFTHRFADRARGNSKEAYGLDGHAYAAFGFDMSFTSWPGLNFQAYRSADQKTITLAFLQKLWMDEGFNVALRVERFDEAVRDNPVTVGYQEGKLGTAVQAPIDWQVAPGITLSAVPTWLSRSNLKRSALTTVGFAARWELTNAHMLSAELYPRPSKQKDVQVGNPPHSLEQGWALGYTWKTLGHRFSVLATNVPGTTPLQVLAGDYAGQGPRPGGDWGLGFNIVRIF